ncbi:2OG-Fe(II) oxygenase [Alteromonas oceanisediminis]|uniref:2OG-Fe(II) oxygenase n=1 Tax=Alteromonas oceanisediminis TaxID=2836180 RepID=UPI001BDA6D48|nr:2OG-Fe(II) oxygenase family protein [Alteromonas oceanisediminis]MBT0586311.1 2OG-Fe(II) oxygenase [Alteromonas oceanisediminis]
MVTINPNLDLNVIKQHYAEDDRTRIPNILPDETAQEVFSALNKSDAFDYAYVKDGRPALLSPSETAAMSPEAQHEMRKKIVQLGSQGVGYLYGRHLIDEQSEALFQAVKAWLNSAETLNMIRQVTGKDDIALASAQATKYMPGHFLTRHQDVHDTEKRRLAYVLNLSPNWHPDWGGLLQFFENDGTPRDAWSPLFNSLSLFDVRHIHSVTYVTPMALTPRVSITGWFRAS